MSDATHPPPQRGDTLRGVLRTPLLWSSGVPIPRQAGEKRLRRPVLGMGAPVPSAGQTCEMWYNTMKRAIWPTLRTGPLVRKEN
jgi:hypothetical protein